MENIIIKLKIPNNIIRYIIMEFLDLKTIHKIFYITKTFNVLNDANKKKLFYASKGFSYCCKNNHLDLAKWLFYSGCIEKKYVLSSAKKNIKYFNLNTVKWLHSLVGFIPDETYMRSIVYGRKLGNFKIAKWIYYLKDDHFSELLNENINTVFMNVCLKGHYKFAKWLFSLNIIKIDYVKHITFSYVCYEGKIKNAKWMYNYFVEKNQNIKFIFKGSKKSKIINWIYSLDSAYVQIDDIKVFNKCCYNGLMITAKWLHSQKNIDHNNNNFSAFKKSCSKGHIEIAKWIHSLGGVDIHSENDYAFRFACNYGHIEIAEWLYSLGGVNIHSKNEDAFRRSCSGDNIELAKWLYSLGGVNIHSKNESSFFDACRFGYIELAKWLYSLGNIDIHINDDIIFRDVCLSDNLEIAQWLHSLGKIEGDIDVHCHNNSAFSESCFYGQLKVAKWLYSVGNTNINLNIDIDDIFIKNCIDGYYDMVIWIHNIFNGKISKKSYNEGFYNCCQNNKLKLAKKLVSFGVDIHFDNDMTIIDLCDSNHLKVLKWIYKLDKEYFDKNEKLSKLIHN